MITKNLKNRFLREIGNELADILGKERIPRQRVCPKLQTILNHKQLPAIN